MMLQEEADALHSRVLAVHALLGTMVARRTVLALHLSSVVTSS